MQYHSHRMFAVCLMLAVCPFSSSLAGCSGLTPGTYSQDSLAAATATMLRSRDGLSARMRAGFAKLTGFSAPRPETGEEGSVPPRAVPPAVPRFELSFCDKGVDPAIAQACCPAQSTHDSQHADDDRDGVLDRCEDLVAERFAPIIYHSSDESNFPTNVDAFLTKTRLAFVDDGCRPDLRVPIASAPSQEALIGHLYEGGCGATDVVRSDGTLSARKHRGFLLEDVAQADRAGSYDSREWTTYVHVYPTRGGRLTLQYWKFYAYNDAANDHGGDWEGVHLVLDENLRPAVLRMPGHWAGLKDMSPSQFSFEGAHVRVYVEGGGHAVRESGRGIEARGCRTHELCTIKLDNPRTYVREETWQDGTVSWFDGRRTEPGPLVNLGSKTAPLNGQVFVQYSGLWGSPGLLYWTSGYWGPAFNETRMAPDGFRSAWCLDMVTSNLHEECYGTSTTR